MRTQFSTGRDVFQIKTSINSGLRGVSSLRSEVHVVAVPTVKMISAVRMIVLMKTIRSCHSVIKTCTVGMAMTKNLNKVLESSEKYCE